MKMLVMGVSRIFGKSKKTGNDYDMCRLFGMTQIAVRKTENMTVEGYGFEVAEIDLDQTAVHAFKDVKFPAQLDLETDVVAQFGEFKTVVCGIRKAA